MNRDFIIGEIRRTATANGGVVLGWRRFEEETGIGYYDWFGKFWTRWGDAVREAGFEPNRMSAAYDDDFLLERLALLTRRLRRVPVRGDLLLAAKNEAAFPSEKAFRRFGSRGQLASRVVGFCEANPSYHDVLSIWGQAPVAEPKPDEENSGSTPAAPGYVYLLRHGTRREYKIGRTNNPVRREGEVGIQLPEKLQPVHYIETDDPGGIENYWHSRFSARRKEGEWFALTAQDVRAFKRWKRIF